MTDASVSPTRVRLIRLAALAVLAALWEGMAISGLFYEGVVPRIELVAAALVEEIFDPALHRDLAVTLFEAAVGFIGGSAIAILLGTWLGLRPFARRAAEPYIAALGGTPKIIFLPIIFLIFGLGMESKMAKGALSAFFPVMLSTVAAAMTMSPVLLKVGKSFSLTPWQTAIKIYVPAMANPVLTGLRLGMAMAIIGILAAEVAYSDSGLGFRLVRYADRFQIPAMYATIIIIFAVTALINSAINMLQQRFNRHVAAPRRSPRSAQKLRLAGAK